MRAKNIQIEPIKNNSKTYSFQIAALEQWNASQCKDKIGSVQAQGN
jgi:hypothetical protein